MERFSETEIRYVLLFKWEADDWQLSNRQQLEFTGKARREWAFDDGVNREYWFTQVLRPGSLSFGIRAGEAEYLRARVDWCQQSGAVKFQQFFTLLNPDCFRAVYSHTPLPATTTTAAVEEYCFSSTRELGGYLSAIRRTLEDDELAQARRIFDPPYRAAKLTASAQLACRWFKIQRDSTQPEAELAKGFFHRCLAVTPRVQYQVSFELQAVIGRFIFQLSIYCNQRWLRLGAVEWTLEEITVYWPSFVIPPELVETELKGRVPFTEDNLIGSLNSVNKAVITSLARNTELRFPNRGLLALLRTFESEEASLAAKRLKL